MGFAFIGLSEVRETAQSDCRILFTGLEELTAKFAKKGAKGAKKNGLHFLGGSAMQ